ncbi:MAG: FumA C-terminus/TtdB family hydratase beta subunit [Christensenellales bacterium]|jgi:fumarate hydratase subunit beta
MLHRLTTPLSPSDVFALTAGDTVLLSGVLHTGRDAAHKRIAALLAAGEPLPFDIRGAALYYTGPCPAPQGFPIGSCGPTTSGRMDAYTPLLLQAGLTVMIGKGGRSPQVVEAMVRHGAVYLAATGGAGALLAGRVRGSRVVAFPELGAEAVYRLEVSDMPLIVAIDSRGRDLYAEGPGRYARDSGT